MSNKNFLPNHPQITKKVNYSTSKLYPYQSSLSNYDDNSLSSQIKLGLDSHIKISPKTIQKIILYKSYSIKKLVQTITQLKKKNSIISQSLQHYNLKPQLKPLQQKLKSIKQQQKQVNQQIKNCQMVQQNASPQQYFIWKKNQRISIYQSKVNQLYQANSQQRQLLQTQCSIFSQKVKEIQQQIIQLQNNLQVLSQIDQHKSQTLSSKKSKLSHSQPQNIPQITQEEYQKLKQEYQQLSSSNQMVQQNRKILSTQLNDNCQSILNSLGKYFQNTKNNIIKQLKKTRQSINQQQLIPITNQQKQYSIAPLISDYQIKMRQLKQSLSNQLKQKVGPLLKPLEWRSFKYEQLLQVDKNQISTYNEYKLRQDQCMKQQLSIKELQQQLTQLDNHIAEYKQKNIELQATLNKLNMVYKK